MKYDSEHSILLIKIGFYREAITTGNIIKDTVRQNMLGARTRHEGSDQSEPVVVFTWDALGAF